MLSLDASLSANCSYQDFWHLPVSKELCSSAPEYFIGQTVFHRMKTVGGEILHPVEVTGTRWTGIDWEYSVVLPPEHPMFEEEDCEWLSDLNHWNLEAL
jgi:hypothetical protein